MTTRAKTCWKCGATVPAENAVRMTVRTGYSVGRSYRGYYGQRTLCAACAEAQRRHNTRINLAFLIIVAVAAVLWFIAANLHLRLS